MQEDVKYNTKSARDLSSGEEPANSRPNPRLIVSTSEYPALETQRNTY